MNFYAGVVLIAFAFLGGAGVGFLMGADYVLGVMNRLRTEYAEAARD